MQYLIAEMKQTNNESKRLNQSISCSQSQVGGAEQFQKSIPAKQKEEEDEFYREVPPPPEEEETEEQRSERVKQEKKDLLDLKLREGIKKLEADAENAPHTDDKETE